MMGYYDYSYGYGMGFIGIFFMALFWIGLIWFIVWLIRHSKIPENNISGNISDKTPLQILKERYAKGEINKKEFDEMRKDIEK